MVPGTSRALPEINWEEDMLMLVAASLLAPLWITGVAAVVFFIGIIIADRAIVVPHRIAAVETSIWTDKAISTYVRIMTSRCPRCPGNGSSEWNSSNAWQYLRQMVFYSSPTSCTSFRTGQPRPALPNQQAFMFHHILALRNQIPAALLLVAFASC